MANYAVGRDTNVNSENATENSLTLDSTADHHALFGRIEAHIAAVVAAVG